MPALSFPMLAILFSLLVACGGAELDCADDPSCEPAPPCGPAGCGGGSADGGSGGMGGSGGEGGTGGSGGSGGATERPDELLCEETCNHVYFDCGSFWLNEQGGIVERAACETVCLGKSIEAVRCYHDAMCFDWEECAGL